LVTVSMRVLSAGAGYRYLLKSVAADDGDRSLSTPLTRYYREKGTPPGYWMGTGVGGLGDGSLAAGHVVTETHLRRLLGHGHDPLTGEPLGRSFFQFKHLAERIAIRTAALDTQLSPAQRERSVAQLTAEERERPRPRTVAGYDYTFSVPKSVSVLWALVNVDTQTLIMQAHHAAVADVMELLERDVAMTRTGSGGVAQVETRGVVATAFDHYDSRASDPQLHTHVVIANRVQGRDGAWRTLDGRPMHAAVVALSEHYNAVLADHLTRDLGVAWEQRDRGRDRNPAWEIAGVGDELVQEFSSRAADIEVEKDRLIAEYLKVHGRRPSTRTVLRLRQQATLATRPDKEVRSLAELTDLWRGRAGSRLEADPVGWALDLVAAGGERAVLRADDLPHDVIEQLAAVVVEVVGEKRATWRRWNLHAEASRQLMHLRFASTSDREAVVGLVVDAAEHGSLRLTPPEVSTTPEAFRRADGSSVFRPKYGIVYSSTAVFEAEDRLLRLAGTRTSPTVDLDVVARAVGHSDGGVVLAADQVLAVEKIATSARIVDVLVGPAGTGKTTTLSGLRRAWEAQVGSVVGLAPSATAAEVLAADLGVQTETTAKWLYEHRNGRWNLQPGQLVIVDEASLAGTFALDAIAAHAADVGAKLLLVGDWAQLDAVDTGGAFGLLTRSRDDAARLTDTRRFVHPWEKAASLRLRLGEEGVIKTYEAHGRVVDGDHDVMLEAAYRAWQADLDAGRSTLLITEDSETVAALNARARNDRVLAGLVADDGFELADGNRAGQGDIVITRRNDRRLNVGRGWVKNGDRWIITSHHLDGAVTVRRAGSPWPGTVTLPAWYAAEHLDLGYAITTHRAEGATVDTSHVIVRSTSMTREALYVAMTRGRHSNVAYVATDQAHLEEHQKIAGDNLTAWDVLQAVLRHSGSELSAHETLTAEQDTWGSIAQLAAEYETIAQHAQADQVVALFVEAGLDDRLLNRLATGDTFGTLVAELRRAEASGLDPAVLARYAVLGGSLEDAADVASLLRFRVQHLVDVSPVRARRPAMQLIVGLIPPAGGPMTGEMTSTLAELENLMEARATALTTAAVTERQQWIRRCGARPGDPDARRRWERAVRVVAAYRDRYGLTDDDAVGPVPPTDLERLDHGRAVLALRDAARLAATAQPGHPESERDQSQALGG
jgi:conjugative relaxase-like TrwC/TraI family protein